jgi:DnaJ-class molecular chaperone
MFSRLVLAGLVRLCPSCGGSGKNKYGGVCNPCMGTGNVPGVSRQTGGAR